MSYTLDTRQRIAKAQYVVRLRAYDGTWRLDGNGWERRTHEITWSVETTERAAITELNKHAKNPMILAAWIEEPTR